MKKAIIAFIAGVAITATVFAAYAHQNMINMNSVVDIESNEYGTQIILSSGDVYWWER